MYGITHAVSDDLPTTARRNGRTMTAEVQLAVGYNGADRFFGFSGFSRGFDAELAAVRLKVRRMTVEVFCGLRL